MVNIIEVFHTMYFAGLKIDLVFHPPTLIRDLLEIALKFITYDITNWKANAI